MHHVQLNQDWSQATLIIPLNTSGLSPIVFVTYPQKLDDSLIPGFQIDPPCSSCRYTSV